VEIQDEGVLSLESKILQPHDESIYADSSANGLCRIGLLVLGLAECTVAMELAAMTQYELAKHMNVLVIINRKV
jgi:hypothetical protein